MTNRGNDRKVIFKDDVDRRVFLELFANSIDNYQVVVHGFAMMTNHYHFLIETPIGNLAEFMRHFNISYTYHFNRRHGRSGHLFQGRYKSVLVDKESYLSAVSKYIHLNPIKVRGHISKSLDVQMEYLLNYKWSSLPGFLNPKKRYPFMEHTLVLEAYGGDNSSGRRLYKKDLEAHLTQDESLKPKVIGQCILGQESFVAWVKQTFLEKEKDREQPSVARLYRTITQGEILALITNITGKSATEILETKGDVRQMAMDLLYRFGGMKNKEIGDLMGIDYSTVSQGRKRLKIKRAKSRSLNSLILKAEERLSRIKI